jgi:hypothetical protein
MVTNVVLTHPLTATMTVTGLGALALLEPGVERRRRWVILAVVAAACLAVELCRNTRPGRPSAAGTRSI